LDHRRPSEPDPDNAGGGKQWVNKSKSKSTFNAKVISEIAIFVALSAVLSYIKVFSLPQGGSVTLGGMIPILLLALRRGWRTGIFGGFILGLLMMWIEPFFVHPAQILLDYLLAFGVLGLAGFFRKHPPVGVATGMTGRFIAHFLSGVIFYDLFIAAGAVVPQWILDIGLSSLQTALIYSSWYNATYMLPELIVSSILIYLLSKKGVLEIYL